MASNGLPLADNGRVAVHTFDENSSPKQKAAAAGKARDQLQSVNGNEGERTEREVPIDMGGSGVVPTITVQDADSKQPLKNDSLSAADTMNAPGALPTDVAPAIPDWYRVGWRQMSNIDAPPLSEGEEKDKGVLDLFLAEQFYGAWYHNAALVVFAVFASHFLTRFHFGWGWLFILLAICNTYYTTSMERTRRRSRDDIQRELVKTRLVSNDESADWMNNFLDRFWLIYEPVLSATIVSSVDQILSTNTPPFLDSIRLTQFTLGTKAPRIDKVKTDPNTSDEEVDMIWGISFTPNDISDMTPKQAAAKVNPKIVLSIRVGKGLATGSMPILLEDITFSGVMKIKLKLMSNFPHVKIVELSFMEKPVIDYVLKPVGGDFGIDIAHIPGLSSSIREMTHQTLGPMMYWPNVFTLNLEQMLSGTPLDTSIGVLQVTIHSARGITGVKLGGGKPDPFIGLSINNRAELAHTKYKSDTYNPTWSETKFLLVNSLSESLILNLWDFNDHRKNQLLGSASFEMSVLQEDATQEGQVSQILKDGKPRGELRYDVSFYPVLKPETGKELPETSVGIVRLTVHQAKDLDNSKSMSGDLNPIAKVYLGADATPIHQTKLFKHTNNPVWESAHEFICAERASSVITVKIIDDRDFLKDPVVGYMSVKLDDLLAAKETQQDWFPLSNCKSGKLRVTAEWKPLNMAGSLHGADQYSPPIGAVRLWLDKATDVKNVEAALGGKSDPYVRVLVNNSTKGRTEVVNNNLNPVWDQILYVPVHNLKESILLECMDYQHLTKDRSLGSVELHVSDLASASDEKDKPFKSTGLKEESSPLLLEDGATHKGKLHYRAEFIPAFKLKWHKFDAPTNEMQRAAENGNDEDGGTVSSQSSVSEKFVPPGLTRSAESADGPAATPDPAEMNGTAVNGVSESATSVEDEGADLSAAELLTHQSGIIIFNIISGSLPKKTRLEVLLDDGYWPCFGTPKARSTQAQWEYVGEGFLKELDFGQVWLRLNEAEEGDKEAIISEWKGDAKPFLEAALTGPQTYTLADPDGRHSPTITLQARYVPVPVTLEARESVNNQGVLRVDLLDGHGIVAADRGGKSDPFAVFSLNGQKIFKSQTKKKTLNPEWNEDFTTQVTSRVGANFTVEIFDWNQIEQAKSLGAATIDLSELEPFHAVEREFALSSAKHGDQGHVRVRLMFQPEIIAKSRKNTSTFSTAGRAMTQFGGLPVTAGKGVLHGVTGVFKKQKDEELPIPASSAIPSGQASHPIGQVNSMVASAFPPSPSAEVPPSGHQEPGTLRLTVVDGKDLGSSDLKPYVTVRVGDKEQKTKHSGKTATPEWNEGFVFVAGQFTPKIYVWVHDHKTLGKDKLLGEGEVDIWRHIKPEGVSSSEVLLELREGQGLIKLRLEFDANSNPMLGSSSTSSSNEKLAARTLSISSPSRFSLRGRRPGDKEDDE
ncbi:C2 domain-containing protein [Mycena floridula]|nr:C2 domain-containing protein [Mycena floridula]